VKNVSLRDNGQITADGETSRRRSARRVGRYVTPPLARRAGEPNHQHFV